jgi:hypothetical protein
MIRGVWAGLLAIASAPLLAQAPPSDWAAAWFPIGSDASGTVWLIKAGDMNNTSNYRPWVWVMKDHSRDRGTKARTSQSLQIIDCAARTSDVRTTIGFRANGTLLWNAQSHAPNPQPILPATMADIVRRSVCPKN